MRIGHVFEYPPAQAGQREKARKLAWLSIVLLSVGTVLLAITLGQSEAMKTAWVSEVLAMIPPASLLVAMRFELRPPSVRFPYGYYRAIAVVFLITATMLSLIGLSLFFDSAMKLLKQERPPIGTFALFGHQYDLWAGWPMVAVLAFSLGAGMLIGLLKQPVSKALHDKELEAESQMNRDEWMSEGVAIVGLLLVAFGKWWGDALAALLISIGIVRDGWHNMRQVIADLMDETPTQMGGHELEDLPARLRDAAERMPWVTRAMVRLREHGRVLTGEVFVVPRDDTPDLVGALSDAALDLQRLDWRLHELTVVPVRHLEAHPPPKT
ncbi:cation efflux protein [Gemmatirosa kalamazoonensis]|uniref:Cation efflux protein n=1 Tax=Gemmatirosa kalamazoonensis TaxID=861299 RepID=W0RCW3_9BACT|nr:cation transporter [Gemmatirosa kalamazoonensis]AHG88267.1 cation efflux protein [Gemmatirosa kalamazoonensis]